MASAAAIKVPYQEHHAKMMEQHHKQLPEALKLTPEQEPAWNKLMETGAQASAGSGEAEDWTKLKAPERAEKM
ncbi:MAG: Spy/CpxP family protein refolding chaperone [Betaproteobacteria bacterium]|nr:Spy/CpxP family protein refolding chaperone [Candidatus Dechloromonas phosphorivorans]